jgi:hypothetical protein
MSFDWSLVYTVVALTVFGVGWLIAYARGYSAGHDDGYTEATLSYNREFKRYLDGGRRG